MRAERPLRFAGRAGRIENRRVVLGLKRDRRERTVRQRAPIVRLADDVGKRLDQRMPRGAERTSEKDAPKIAAKIETVAHALETFALEKREFCARIDKPIFEFGPFPPSVEQRRDAAGNHSPKEHGWPFR